MSYKSGQKHLSAYCDAFLLVKPLNNVIFPVFAHFDYCLVGTGYQKIEHIKRPSETLENETLIL